MFRIISLGLLLVSMTLIPKGREGSFGMSWLVCSASGICLGVLGVTSMLPDSLVRDRAKLIYVMFDSWEPSQVQPTYIWTRMSCCPAEPRKRWLGAFQLWWSFLISFWMMDLPLVSVTFTWSNNQGSPPLGPELIDSWYLWSRKPSFLMCSKGGFARIISQYSLAVMNFIRVVGPSNLKICG